MLANFADKLSLGVPATHRNLTLTPILAVGGSLLSIEPKNLGEALADRSIEVNEVSAHGHVPELRVKNVGEVPVLILDGEELVGAKQNRIVNVTVLAPPRSEIVIPVSCVEAGRWSYARPGFAAAERVLNHKTRARKAEAVTRNLKARQARFSDQQAVWNEINDTLYALGAFSPTSALSSGFENRANALDEYVAAFRPRAGQVGIVYRIGGALAGLDLFGSERVFSQALPKLVRGLGLQALAGTDRQTGTAVDEDGFLRAALDAPRVRFPAVGLGEEVRFDGGDIGGGGLQLDGGLVHLFAYPRP